MSEQDEKCPQCDGGGACDDCHGFGTYTAYASEQMNRLRLFFQKRAVMADALEPRPELEVRKAALIIAARGLISRANAHHAQWCRIPETKEWDKGFVAGMKAAGHAVANSIDRHNEWDETSA